MEHVVYIVKIDTIMEYPLHYNPHYNEIGRPERGTLMPYHSRLRIVRYRCQQKRSQHERIISHRPQQEKMCIASCTKIDYPSNSDNEKLSSP